MHNEFVFLVVTPVLISIPIVLSCVFGGVARHHYFSEVVRNSLSEHGSFEDLRELLLGLCLVCLGNVVKRRANELYLGNVGGNEVVFIESGVSEHTSLDLLVVILVDGFNLCKKTGPSGSDCLGSESTAEQRGQHFIK